MNQRDVELMQAIMKEIGRIGAGERVLFKVPHSIIVHSNLVILKILLDEWMKQGIFITIDRPHTYMEHLLVMQKIKNRHRLSYIDAIGDYSGSEINSVEKRAVTTTPFHIERLPDELIKGIKNRGSVIDMKRNDFILIDNLAAMLNYNTLEDTVKFVDRYLKAIALYNSIFTALFIDSRNYPELYDAIIPLCDVELEINKKMEVKKPEMDFENDSNVVKINSKKKRIIRSILLFSPDESEKKSSGKPDIL